jgi:hypothetical protein
MKRTKPVSKVKPETRKKTGPKSKCTPDVIEKTEHFVGFLGARNADLAILFDVDVTTIEYWARTIPEFKKALDTSRLKMGEKVAKSLVLRATGFTMPEEKIFCDKGEIIRAETTKYYPPDSWAAHKWLSIMFRDTWSDSATINHIHSGNIDHSHRKIEDIPISDFTEAEKDLILSIGQKQLKEAGKN